MMSPLRRYAALALLLAAPFAAFAQTGHGGHGSAPAAKDPAAAEYQAAMDRMHKDMMIPYAGTPDRHFALGMIPHHQGAIDMARIQLKHGKDPELRKLAQEIIAAQEKEIAQLKTWLARNPG